MQYQSAVLLMIYFIISWLNETKRMYYLHNENQFPFVIYLIVFKTDKYAMDIFMIRKKRIISSILAIYT